MSLPHSHSQISTNVGLSEEMENLVDDILGKLARSKKRSNCQYHDAAVWGQKVPLNGGGGEAKFEDRSLEICRRQCDRLDSIFFRLRRWILPD